MIILKMLISLLILFIIPELVGLLVVRFTKNDKNNLIFAFVIGYLIEFAIAQILTVPMIFYEVSFTILLKIYSIIMLVLALISLLINVTRIKEIFESVTQTIKNTPKVLTILVIFLIGIQLYGFWAYTHIDEDDAFYVGTATTTVETDSLYKYSGTTGLDDGEQFLLRYRLGPFPVYSAIVSKLINIQPAIVSHTILPFVFVPIVYFIYLLIANELFKKDINSSMLFLLIINIVFIWGGYSGRTNFAFMFFRIWQGKSVLANIIIPATWLIMIKAEENEFEFVDFVLLLILNLAGTFTTTLGTALPPIVIMVLWFSYEIYRILSKKFKFSKGIKSMVICLVSCTPSIICGILHFAPYFLESESYLYNLLCK